LTSSAKMLTDALNMSA